MTKKLLIVLGLTSLLAFTGCGDETQASAPAEQVNDGSIRLDKIIDFMDLNSKELSFLTEYGYGQNFQNVFTEYKITIRDIKELFVIYYKSWGANADSLMNPDTGYYWFGKNVQKFKNSSKYSEYNAKNYKSFIDSSK